MLQAIHSSPSRAEWRRRSIHFQHYSPFYSVVSVNTSACWTNAFASFRFRLRIRGFLDDKHYAYIPRVYTITQVIAVPFPSRTYTPRCYFCVLDVMHYWPSSAVSLFILLARSGTGCLNERLLLFVQDDITEKCTVIYTM